jgi:hypothetical protein
MVGELGLLIAKLQRRSEAASVDGPRFDTGHDLTYGSEGRLPRPAGNRRSAHECCVMVPAAFSETSALRTRNKYQLQHLGPGVTLSLNGTYCVANAREFRLDRCKKTRLHLRTEHGCIGEKQRPREWAR